MHEDEQDAVRQFQSEEEAAEAEVGVRVAVVLLQLTRVAVKKKRVRKLVCIHKLLPFTSVYYEPLIILYKCVCTRDYFYRCV